MSGSCNNHSSENSSQGALIFLHAGTYRGEFLVIDSDIALIGMYELIKISVMISHSFYHSFLILNFFLFLSLIYFFIMLNTTLE